MGFSWSALWEAIAGWRRDVAVAGRFLTWLPMPAVEDLGERTLAESARAFPFVGLAVGALAAIAFLIAAQLGWHPLAGAGLALATACLATGALHEDGLADVADGFGGGASRDDKLAIMRDSRIGSFGVLALVFSVGLRAGALVSFRDAGAAALALIAAHTFSRAVLPAAMRTLPPARAEGLGFDAGQPSPDAVALAGLIGALLAVLFLGLAAGLVAVIAGAFAAFLFGALAQRQIGGHTGDVLGALQQVTEVTVLLAAAAVLA
jgi:adenosylcobinamide-GDP ribazoletransferase